MDQQNSNNSAPSTPSGNTTPVASHDNQQKPPIHEDLHTGYEQLKQQYRLAIDLRLQWYPYRVISKKLEKGGFKATEMTLEKWFSKGGFCHEVYNNMRALRARELEEEIKEQQNMLEQGKRNSLIILNRALDKAVENDEISTEDYNNARDMLDRTGVPKQTKTDINGKIESEGVKEMAGLIKAVLESKGLPLPEVKDESE